MKIIDRKIISGLFLLVFSLNFTANACGDDGKSFDTLTVYWENDAFIGNDGDYTNGLKFTWSSPYIKDEMVPNLSAWKGFFINNLPFLGDSHAMHATSTSIGQDIYTPEDASNYGSIAGDRPYAGYLYSSVGFYSKTAFRKDSWEFQLGVVGPLSFAEETQSLVHRVIGSDHPEGWDSQLRNEIAIDAIYEAQWLSFVGKNSLGYGIDLIPHLGFRLGNVATYLNAGAELRFGINLPDNFGSCPIRAGCQINSAFNNTDADGSKDGFTGWLMFVAVDGRAVAYDIFLDGNTFVESYSVDREFWVADLMAGVAFGFDRTRVTYSYVMRTKQFDSEADNQIFGSLSFSLAF